MKKIFGVLVFVFVISICVYYFNYKTKPVNQIHTSFDVVIPVVAKDDVLLQKQVKSIKKHVNGCKNIYIVSNKNYNIDGTIWFDENDFPFKKSDFTCSKIATNRRGWYYQQFLKLYAGFVIPKILPNYMVVDASIVFCKPINVIKDGKYLFNFYEGRDEYHKPYFSTMKLMNNSFKKVGKETGICEYMIFNKDIIDEIITCCNCTRENFISYCMSCIDKNPNNDISLFSEFELYFNFMRTFHPEQFEMVKYPYTRAGFKDMNNNNFQKRYHYISFQDYM